MLTIKPARREASNMVKRVIVAAVLLPPVLWIVYWRSVGFQVLAAVACFAAFIEVGIMADKRLEALNTLGEALIPYAGWVYIMVGYIAIIYVREHYGSGAILLTFAIAFGGDTMALIGGRRYGCNPLAPSISPGKTWQGAWFGLAGSVAFATILGHFWFAELALLPCIAIALVGGVAGQCGDLFESKIKRLLGAKDSSNLLPGHGGMFDRIDALLAVGMVVNLGLRLAIGA